MRSRTTGRTWGGNTRENVERDTIAWVGSANPAELDILTWVAQTAGRYRT